MAAWGPGMLVRGSLACLACLLLWRGAEGVPLAAGPMKGDAAFKKVLLKTKDALCLDGTPGGYYIRAGDPKKWILHLEGGGWCVDEADCAGRALTDLGSSSAWPQAGIPLMDGGSHGMFSLDPAVNPDFYTYTSVTNTVGPCAPLLRALIPTPQVFVCYCDGASFAGNVSEPLVYWNGTANTTLYFRGKVILEAVIQSLLKQGMSSANEIIVKGGSAGGLAVYLHLDYISESVPETAQVSGLADAGFFLDIPDWQGNASYTPHYRKVSEMQQVITDDECMTYFFGEERWRCFMAQYVAAFVHTRLFVLNSFYDTWQLDHILGIGCTKDLAACSEAEKDAFQSMRGTMLTALKDVLKRSSGATGGFLWSCPVHTMTGSDNYWLMGEAQGLGMVEAFGSWYFDRGLSNWTIDCEWPCNSSCPPCC